MKIDRHCSVSSIQYLKTILNTQQSHFDCHWKTFWNLKSVCLTIGISFGLVWLGLKRTHRYFSDKEINCENTLGIEWMKKTQTNRHFLFVVRLHEFELKTFTLIPFVEFFNSNEDQTHLKNDRNNGKNNADIMHQNWLPIVFSVQLFRFLCFKEVDDINFPFFWKFYSPIFCWVNRINNTKCKTTNILKLKFNLEHLFTSKKGMELGIASVENISNGRTETCFFLFSVFLSQTNLIIQTFQCSSATNLQQYCIRCFRNGKKPTNEIELKNFRKNVQCS